MSYDANTERRMERLRQQRQQAALGIETTSTDSAQNPNVRYSHDATSSSSSSAKLFAYAAIGVGSLFLLRTLLKGTAPSTASRYSKFVNHQHLNQQANASGQAHRATYQQAQYSGASSNHYNNTNHSHHSSAGSAGSGSSSSSRTDSSSDHRWHDEASRQAYYEQKWRAAQSDYERYENLQRQARESWSSAQQADSGFRSSFSDWAQQFRDHDPEIEFSVDQARADYVQSKFHSQKSTKRINRYETWSGAATASNLNKEEQEEWRQAMARGEDEDEFKMRFQAYRALQRQMTVDPKYVQARQLLFGLPSTSDPSATSASTSTSSPPDSSMPSASSPLTSQDVRRAYFQQAKLCHPDISGGDSLRFQKLTDAYELLIETLEPMEKKRRNKEDSQPATA